MWKIGGGTVWGWISYDPEPDLIYYGTGNPGPWNPEPAPRATTSGRPRIFARRAGHRRGRVGLPVVPARSARLRRRQRADPARRARRRQPAQGARPARAERLHLRDRPRRRARCSRPTRSSTSPARPASTSRRAGRTGTEAKEPRLGSVVRDICPASPGRKDWQPSAYSPQHRACSTSPIKTCAWTTRAWRPTTSPARRTSG